MNMHTTSSRGLVLFAGLSVLLTWCEAGRAADAVGGVPEDARQVSLFDGGTLLGWEQGGDPSADWQIVAGRLYGTTKAGPLELEQTFGDAAWTIRWKGAADAGLEVEFPEVVGKKGTKGESLKVRLNGGAGCGAIVQGDKTLAAGMELSAATAADHTARLVRKKGELTVSVDGKQVSTAPWNSMARSGLVLRAAKGTVDVASIGVQEEGFHPLFNGQNLSEFNVGDARVRWVVDKEGKIATETAQGNYLRTNNVYENFTLNLEYKVSTGGNSGVGIRTPIGGWPSSDGMEVQILDQPENAAIFSGSLGSLYRNMPPVRRADLRSPAWNRLTIKADGPMIDVWVNGRLVNHCNLAHHYVLRSRGRSGWIGFQDHGGKSEFRNIEILEAPAGDRFPQWTAPKSPSFAGLTLAPVLDPVESMFGRKLETMVVHGRHPGKDEATATLAELKGPGAVARFFRSNDSGELAFYFDGEAAPGLVKSWHKLVEGVPDLGSSRQELVTYLPFRKSLRIEQRGSRPAAYQIGWSRSEGPELPPTSGLGALAGEDRGWQHAIEYLRHNHEYGTTSAHPGIVEVTTGPQEIGPQASVTLCETSRSGISRWLRMYLPEARILAQDQVWLDIFVDGDAKPAISAPLRLLLPALVPDFGGTPVGDLMQVRKQEKYTWLWPMPCARGLKVVARNTGKETWKGISATVALLPREVRDIPAPRLRGLYFRPKSGDSREWLSATGKGRLVWLSVETGDADLGAISKLLVDGQPQSAWENLPVAGWFGRDTPPMPHSSGHSGSVGPLLWKSLLIDPITFQRSLQLDVTVSPAEWQTLALYYIQAADRAAKR